MNATQALGWALLHFLWQGAAVAIALSGVLRATRHHASSIRYLLGVIALAAMLALPLATTLHLTSATPAPREATRMADPSGAVLERTDKMGFETPADQWLRARHAGEVRRRLLSHGPLHDWVDPVALAAALDAWLGGRRQSGPQIWRWRGCRRTVTTS